MKMRAVQVVSPGTATFVTVDKPNLQPGHALIRTAKLSLCGSDIRMLYHADPREYPFPPGTTGHEMVGVVEAMDGESSEFAVGDLVLGLAPGHRAMAEYYLAPLEHVLPLPKGLPAEQLLQAQQLGTVIYACQRLPSLIGKTVAVIGQGSAGLWFNFMLRRLGARRVIALDLDEKRLELAPMFGASETIHNRSRDPVQSLLACNEGQLADVVVEAAGEIDAINLALDLVVKYGHILYFGYPRGQVIQFNFEKYFHECLTATAIVGATAEANQQSTRMAIEMIARGEMDVRPLLTHTFAFDDVLAAYDAHRLRTDGAIKIVVNMPDR